NANAGSAYELREWDSLMTFNSSRTFELYKRYAAPGAYLFLREAVLLPPDPVLDAANVGLVAIHEARNGAMAEALRRGYRSFFNDGRVSLFVRATEPQFYFTSSFRVVTRKQALVEVSRQRPRRQILLEEDPGLPPAPNAASDPPVRVRRWDRNGLTLEVQAPRPGLLYLSQSFFPGWRAEVDGRPRALRVANYAFQAVAVPAGRSVVELSYVPPGLKAGGAVSIAALLVLLGLVWRRDVPIPEAAPRAVGARERRG